MSPPVTLINLNHSLMNKNVNLTLALTLAVHLIKHNKATVNILALVGDISHLREWMCVCTLFSSLVLFLNSEVSEGNRELPDVCASLTQHNNISAQHSAKVTFAALKCISQTSQKLAEGLYKIHHHTTVFILQWINCTKQIIFSASLCVQEM